MANRFPLIFNSGAGQIQELAVSDNLDLTSSNLVNAGILFTSSGSVTAPSLQIGSGTTYNPGLYSPGTDQLAISTNGTGRLFVNASGNIGVGTSTVQSLLHLSASALADLRFTDTGESTDQKNWVFQTGTGIGAGTFRLRAVNDANSSGENAYLITKSGTSIQTHQWLTGGTERLRITSAGNVGIGTTSPAALLDVKVASDAKLLVQDGNTTGNVKFNAVNNAVSANVNLEISASNTQFFNGGTERARIRGDGTFEIKGAGTAGVSPAVSVNPSAPANSAVMDSLGRLGLGTPTPGVKLEARDTIAGGSDNTIATLHNFSDTGGDTRYAGLNFRIGTDNGTSAIRASRTLSSTDYRTDLSFWTNPTGATQTPVRAMTIDYLQRVGIGTTSPSVKLEVSGSGGSNPEIRCVDGTINSQWYQDSSGYSVFGTFSNHPQVFRTNGTEKVRIDISGRLLVGTSTARTNYYNSASIGSNFQVVGSSHAESSIILHNQAANEQGAYFHIGKSRGTAYQVVSNNDPLGIISFQGADGSTMREGATIAAFVDGAPGASDLPTRLVFSTTADGASSPTERMRINSSGQILAGALGTAALPIISFLNDPNTGIYSPGADQLAISTNGTGRLFVDASGRLGLGRSNPSFVLDVQAGAGDGIRYTNSVNSVENILGADSSTGQLGTTTAHPVAFLVGSVERMRVDTSGRLGLGTTWPQEKLEIQDGSISVGSSANTSQANTLIAGYGYILSGTKYGNTSIRSTYNNANNLSSLEFYTSSSATASTERARIRGDGTFEIKGAGTAGVSPAVSVNPSAPANSAVMDSLGRLGLGTSSPGDVLDTAAGNYRGITIKCQTTAHLPTLSFFNTTDSLAAYIQANGNSLAFGSMGTDYGGHTPRMTLTTTGLGISSTAPQNPLVVSNAGANGFEVSSATNSGTTSYLLSYNRSTSAYTDMRFDASAFRFEISASEKARIDSSGRLLVGTSTSVAVDSAGTTFNSELQVAGSSASVTVARNVGSGNLFLTRNQTVTDNSPLGFIGFQGGDGTNLIQAASIQGVVDGTPGANDMPGRLVFSTTADGAASPTERMRINSSGQILAGALGTAALPIISFLNDPNTGIYSPGADQIGIATGGTSRIVVDASGNVNIDSNTLYVDAANNCVGLGTSLPGAKLDISASGNLVRLGDGTNTFDVRFQGPNNWDVQLDTSADTFSIRRNSSSKVTVSPAGNVGIGTTDPSNTIDVNGTGRFRLGGTNQLVFTTDGGNPYILSEQNAPLHFGTNNLLRATIDSSGRLLVGTSSSTGSTSNTAPVVAGLFKSFNGTISSAADETAYTAFAAPNVNATYIVTARVPSTEAATFYEEVAIVSASSGSSVSLDIAILKNGSLMTISLSGANVQVKQGSGATQTINWSAVCIG